MEDKSYADFLRGIPDFYKIEFNINDINIFVNQSGIMAGKNHVYVVVGISEFEQFLDLYIDGSMSEYSLFNIKEHVGRYRYDRILDFMHFLMEKNVYFTAEYKDMQVRYINWRLQYKRRIRGGRWLNV